MQLRIDILTFYRKDWAHNSGDDVAGVVHSVGRRVYEFKTGDRVAALHEFGQPNGAFADYAVAPDRTTFHIPHDVSFEEAVTVPTAALTAAISLHADMGIPAPFEALTSSNGVVAARTNSPLLIYGVSTAVGAFAAKLARLAGVKPIIGVAGRASEFASTVADFVVDYRQGEDALVAAVEALLAKEGLGDKIPLVFDAISEAGSLETTLRFLEPNGGIVSTVLPPILFAREKENFHYPPGVTSINSALPRVHSTHKDWGYIWSHYLGRLMETGRLSGHPHEVIPGGLEGVLVSLQNLRSCKASAVKYVCRIEETAVGAVPRFVGQTPNKAKTKGPHPLRNFPFPA
jgi:NADPH:quinone reductase-like Zn-dependent oxidoreductase